MNTETESYVAITRLQASYADVVTRRAWSEMEPLFAPGASIRVDTVTKPAVEFSGPVPLAEFISNAIARFEFFEFVILNAVVDVHDDDTATGRVYMVEIRQEHESGEWSNAFGVYRDTYEQYDGQWRFSQRRYQSLARRLGLARALVFPMPT